MQAATCFLSKSKTVVFANDGTSVPEKCHCSHRNQEIDLASSSAAVLRAEIENQQEASTQPVRQIGEVSASSSWAANHPKQLLGI